MYVFCVYEYSSTANLLNLICDTVGLISYIYSTVGLGLISYINSTVGLISYTPRIWVSKSGVLKNVFILSKHGTKANIRSTKMANNRHAYNRDVLQSYWTSDGIPLFCSQPTGEKTHTNQ